MEGEALKQGKARVMLMLIDPLVEAGMVRRRGVTIEDSKAIMERLAARLAYMSESNLPALREVVEGAAEGGAKNIWPSEVSICNWARSIQKPPPSESRLVRSMLQSSAGRMAVAQGYVLELFAHLKQYGRPPNEFAINQMRQRGADNAREFRRLSDRRRDGVVTADEAGWLSSRIDLEERVMGIVNAGAAVNDQVDERVG